MKVLVMGPPGVGKGTQSILLAAYLGVPAVSTGELFRTHVRDETPVGLRMKSIIEAGKYVPDEITDEIVGARIGLDDCALGFVLDGYPRTTNQVEWLDLALQRREQRLDLALSLTAGNDEIRRRLRQRAQTESRADDSDDVAAHRIDVYHRETAPLIELYRARGVMREVSSEGSVAEVAHQIQNVVISVLNQN